MSALNKTAAKVSVITSTYNRASELKRAIDSVVSQTFEDWEMCVVGDCTPDNSGEIVSSFNDPRLRYHNLTEKSPPGSHGATAKNYALKNMASGAYITYLDDDDTYRREFLEVMLDYMETHHECEIAYCRGGYRDKRTGKRVWGNPFQRWLHNYSKDKLHRYNFIITSWVIHRADLLKRVGYWNPKTYFDDYDLWLRISEVTDFHFVNRVLMDYYIVPDPFMKRAVTKTWKMLRHGGKRMPRPYDGDYE